MKSNVWIKLYYQKPKQKDYNTNQITRKNKLKIKIRLQKKQKN